MKSAYDFTRSDWGARTAKYVNALALSACQYVVIHWPGSGGDAIGTDRARIADYLRGWQAYHMDSRGWSDIAYSVGVDQAGRVWELRGIDRRDGATSGYGGRSVSILAILATGEKPSAAMLARIARLAGDLSNAGNGGEAAIVPHRALRQTSCPGDALTDWIGKGLPVSASELPNVPGGAVTGTGGVTTSTRAGLVVDGVFGPRTKRALQKLVGTEVDGIWGRKSVAALQEYLNAVNGAGLAVDGIQGPKTVKAVQHYLNGRGARLVVDGVWGPLTTSALQRHLNTIGA